MSGPIPVTSGVWRGGTRNVNWYLVDGGGGSWTLVDCGLPGYWPGLRRSLHTLGLEPADLDALVLTHGHIDHVGTAANLASTAVPVHLHPADQPLAADPRSNKTDKPLLPYLRWPATLGFVVHAVMNGALRPRPMPGSTPLKHGRTLEVPGAPRVVHVPGHTAGSCALDFREHGVVMVGDALCTVSPVSGRAEGPQVQSRASNRDSDEALASLDRLATEVQSRTVLPGHGGPWFDGVDAARDSARRIGCR
jgi:glyoxylase-like metal-dependent hydrolase (beta-lactamase superfamily II)